MKEHLEIVKKMINDDVRAFESIFNEYYHFLCSFAYGMTRERHISEEIVEDFFADLWKNRHQLRIETSVRAYFVRAIHHRCINYLKREKPKYISALEVSQLIDKENLAEDYLILPEVPAILVNELEEKLLEGIDILPPQCKEIFLLSRYQDLSYEQISIRLNISVNTVKTQIKIAFSKLREHLKKYTLLLFLIFFS